MQALGKALADSNQSRYNIETVEKKPMLVCQCTGIDLRCVVFFPYDVNGYNEMLSMWMEQEHISSIATHSLGFCECRNATTEFLEYLFSAFTCYTANHCTLLSFYMSLAVCLRFSFHIFGLHIEFILYCTFECIVDAVIILAVWNHRCLFVCFAH